MFAVLAAVCFFLKLVGVERFDWISLGLLFMALALLFGLWPFGAPLWRRPNT